MPRTQCVSAERNYDSGQGTNRVARAGSRLLLVAAAAVSLWAQVGAMAQTPAFTFTHLAGNANGGFKDGTSETARFGGFLFGAAYDGAGRLYLADLYNGTIREVRTATGEVRTLVGPGGEGGSRDGAGSAASIYPMGLAYDGAGTLYAAEPYTIRKVTIATAEVTTVAGLAGQSGLDDGTGSAARFSGIYGLAYDGAGHLFAADSYGPTIRRIDVRTGEVSTLAGVPGERGTVDGIGNAALFDWPFGVACDRMGNLYVTEGNQHTIRKVVIATGEVTTIAGSAGESGSADGTAGVARFYAPDGITYDGEGNLYVSDWGNHTIRKVNIASGEVSTVAGLAGAWGVIDGTGSTARFSDPQALAYDAAGILYAGEASAGVLRKVVVATREVTTLAGVAALPGSADGIGSAASFDSPWGITYDGAGELFVADWRNSNIRKIAASTGEVTTVAGLAGEWGSADGVGAAARFFLPKGIASDRGGTLFVADTYNHTIRRVVTATGEVTTLAGTVGRRGSVDGTGGAARFSRPSGVACDGAGSVYVADANNHTIRKVVAATGEVTTAAGLAGVPGSQDGAGSEGRFYNPSGIASDGLGSLYITDAWNCTIRKLVTATGEVTTVAGLAGAPGCDFPES